MSETTTVAETPAILMPYEGKGMTEAEAAEALFDLPDSDEESPATEQEDTPDEATDADDGAESEDESDETSDDGEESDATRDDADPEPDAPHAEMEKRLQADYTRKTQALAEERKSFEAEREQIRGMRDQYAAVLAQAEKALEPVEVNWAALREELDPAEYAARFADHQIQMEKFSAVRAERERVDAERIAEQEAEHRAFLASETEKLLAAIPEWSDKEKAGTEKRALMDYARSLGYSDDELGAVYDHRLILVLRDAKRFRDLSAKADAVKAKGSEPAKVLKPGGREAPSKMSTQQVRTKILTDRLKQTGSARDAAALFMEMLPD